MDIITKETPKLYASLMADPENVGINDLYEDALQEIKKKKIPIRKIRKIAKESLTTMKKGNCKKTKHMVNWLQKASTIKKLDDLPRKLAQLRVKFAWLDLPQESRLVGNDLFSALMDFENYKLREFLRTFNNCYFSSTNNHEYEGFSLGFDPNLRDDVLKIVAIYPELKQHASIRYFD